jgi:hypothetical protein
MILRIPYASKASLAAIEGHPDAVEVTYNQRREALETGSDVRREVVWDKNSFDAFDVAKCDEFIFFERITGERAWRMACAST